MSSHFTTRFVVGLVLCCFAGCQSLRGDKGLEANDETEFGTPAKVVAIWTNSVFNEQGKPPVRGLGGRVYFYDAAHKPIMVDGKLSVFLYDDTDGGSRKKQEATKVVHFSASELAANFTPTEFGASYSFWVPWDEVGGKRTQLSVIPVFSTERGQMIVGKEARHLLPGAAPTQLAKDGDGGDSNVSTAGFDEDGSNPDTIAQTSAEGLPTRPKSTTIKLSPTLRRRLRSSRPSQRRPYTPRKADRRRDVTTTQARQTTPTNTNALATGTAATDALAGVVATETPEAGSQPDLRRVQALRFGPQETARARNPLALGGSQFSQ